MYQVNVVIDFPNTSDPNGKPVQKNFAFDIDHYTFKDSIPRSVINEEIVKKGHDLSTVIGVAFDVRYVEPKKKK